MIFVTYATADGALINISDTLPAPNIAHCTRSIDAASVDVSAWNPATMRFDTEGATVRRITKQDLIDRMQPEEMAGILTAAKTDVMAEAWLFRFNSVTPDPDGTSIDLDDPRTVAGLTAMFGAVRATEILA